MSLAVKSYDRRSAAAYAQRWAYFRNPDFLDFSDLGGDCTNFASQCIYAGSGVMNFTPTYGWYYLTSSNRTASWTGVHYLYQFLTSNQGVGPYATETGLLQMRPGDIIQLALDEDRFQHSPVVVEIRGLIPRRVPSMSRPTATTPTAALCRAIPIAISAACISKGSAITAEAPDKGFQCHYNAGRDTAQRKGLARI